MQDAKDSGEAYAEKGNVLKGAHLVCFKVSYLYERFVVLFELSY